MEINLYFERINIMDSMKEKVEIACGSITIGVFIAVGMRLANYIMNTGKDIIQNWKETHPKKES